MNISKKFQSISPSSTLAITAKVNEMKANGINVVGFGAGEPDFNTPEHIREAAIQAINDGFTRYTPASGTKELKAAVAAKFLRENGLSGGVQAGGIPAVQAVQHGAPPLREPLLRGIVPVAFQAEVPAQAVPLEGGVIGVLYRVGVKQVPEDLLRQILTVAAV